MLPRNARGPLTDAGLGGKDAVLAIHHVRSLLECVQFVRKTAVHVITTRVLVALLAGIAMKLPWFERARRLRKVEAARPRKKSAKHVGHKVAVLTPVRTFVLLS